MDASKDSLTFDDVSLVPQHSSVLPSETETFSKLYDNLYLQIPLMSSAMDTVTESRMAIAISKLGGIGVIHRNLSIEKQVMEVKKVKKNNNFAKKNVATKSLQAIRIFVNNEISELIKGVRLVAKKLGVSLSNNGKGYRSLVNIGAHGGQEVPHLHFHLFGGEKVGKMVS